MFFMSGTAPPRWVRAADAAALLLLGLALMVWLAGGFVVQAGGMRLSLRSAWRIVGWVVALIVFRHALFPRPFLHQRLIAGARAMAARARLPLPQDDLGERAADPTAPASPVRAVTMAIAVIVLFWVLTFVVTYPQVMRLGRGVSPDRADPLFSTWRLAWFAHQLPRDPWHLFDANIFYPSTGTLAFSDSMLVPSLTAAPLLWLGLHQLLVANLLLLSGFALSGAGMFLLVRSLTRHTGAAVVAGFVFAFLPYRFMHYAHLELQMAQWMPLCLWALHRTALNGRLRDGLLTGVFLALQTLSSFYYGIFFATYLVPVSLALLAAAPPGRLRPALRSLAAGAVLAVILVAPVTRPYFAARQSVGERSTAEVEFYSAKPTDYLVAHASNTLLGPVTAGLGGQERELFSGFAVPLLALAALWPPISAARMGYVVALALAFELSLGTNGLLYPWLREYFLPFRGLRVPARMAILVGLSLSILVGYAVARISRAGSSRATRIMAVGIMAAVIAAEYDATVLLRDVWRAPAPVYAAVAAEPDAVLLELPLIAPDVALEPVYMYFSTFHWHPLANGYSGFSPPAYGDLLRTMKTFPDDQSMAELRRRGVDYVIVHGAFFRPGILLALLANMEARADLTLVESTLWERRETRLYRVMQ